MVTLSSVGAAALAASQPAAKTNASASTSASSRAAVAQSVTSVTIGQSTNDIDNQLYASDGSPLKVPAPVQVWETAFGDAISGMMKANFGAPNTSLGFMNLGEALLERLRNGSADADNFSQSIVQFAAGSSPTASLQAATQSQVHTLADNQIGLTIQTASGAKVQVTLGSQYDGLAVQVSVTGGALSDTERDALADLGTAFQKAIDGVTKSPPVLDLSGLTKFDSSVLTSIDLHASIKVNATDSQVFDFSADSTKRTVSSSGPLGSMNVSVDLSNVAVVGTAKQQAAAMTQYLKQFDYERQRGHGDTTLMSMFKDAFTGLNSNYPTPAMQSTDPDSLDKISLTQLDRSVLTGLADFSASVSQNPVASNPKQPSELDAFSYQVSQQSTVKGPNQLNRSISQTQQSHLTASYHESLIPGVPLQLSNDNKSQNYTYHQIDDQASSTATLSYVKGAIVKASLVHTASQSTRVQKYEMGALTDDKKTSQRSSNTEDFLEHFKSALQGDDDKTSLTGYLGQQALQAINDMTVLQSDPSQIDNLLQGQKLHALLTSSDATT